jgi:hypothetical protein
MDDSPVRKDAFEFGSDPVDIIFHESGHDQIAEGLEKGLLLCG